MSYDITLIIRIFEGSDGEATAALYRHLETSGPAGVVAVNLFRAQKNPSRAKVYRGGGYRGMAYDRKQWAMENLCNALAENPIPDIARWGWGEDPDQPVHNAVLYIDLPTGQVSFHTGTRGDGPTYAGDWDGMRGHSADRILRWVARIAGGTEQAIRAKLAELYSADEIEVWLTSPQRLLDGKSPRELIDAGQSDAVTRLLRQLEEGVYT